MTQLLPNWIQANTYSARLDRQVIKATFTEGVLEGMKVSQRASGGANMSVDIAVGVGVIYGDDQADQGAYLVTCTVLENVVIAAAPGSNSRRDLIFWRVNDPNAGGPAGSTSSFGVVAGTASASPTLPALPTSAIPLAEVLVTAGDVSVLDAKITSLRTPSYNKQGVSTGFASPWFGPESTVPADCVLLNGQALNKDTDWRLFSIYGTTYGSTSTTFNVPDMRGRLPLGLDNMGGVDAGRLTMTNTLGGTGGEEKHSLTTTELAQHNHSVANHQHTFTTSTHSGHSHEVLRADGALQPVFATVTYPTSGSLVSGFDWYGPGAGGNNRMTTGNAGAHNHTGTTDAAGAQNTSDTGSGTPHNVLNPYILCNWIVRR